MSRYGLDIKCCMHIHILDIDECAVNRDSCGTNSLCVNKAPLYDCNCKDGFAKKGEACIGRYLIFRLYFYLCV